MFPGKHAAIAPTRPAIIMAGTGQTMTYAELELGSRRLANLLRRHCLHAGDHLAVLMDNHLRYLEVVWGALRCGLQITTVNRYLTGPEAAYIVADCGATALITSEAMADVAQQVSDACPELSLKLMVGPAATGFSPYDADTAAQDDSTPEVEPFGEFMLYSSGTTGVPKGILRPLSGRSITDGPAVVTGLGAVFGFNDRTVYLSSAPLYHAAPLGFCVAVQALGGTVIVMDHFDALEALREIERHRVTASQWVPTMFTRMLKLPEHERHSFDLSTMTLAIHAAAPCPVPVKQQMIDWWGPILVEYYGGSEGAGMTMCSSAEWLDHQGTVGRAVLGAVRICDDTGIEVSIGQTGTVYFEQPVAPFEYHGDADKTIASRHPQHEGWTTMGDIGHLDGDGYLYLTDRRSFTIISGGVNVYPQEVENVLTTHPAVADAAVIGFPDLDLGEAVTAVLELEPREDDSDELRAEIVELCRSRLAGYKVPRAVIVVEALPRLPTGKLYKAALRDRLLADRAASTADAAASA